MKKIIIALMALIITFGLLGIGTYAVFGEPETDNKPIINNPTLTLDVEKENGAVRTYTFKNIKPGDSGGWIGYQNLFDGMTWTVQNTGSLDGTLEVSIEDIVDTGAELSTQIKPQMRADGDPVMESSDLTNLQTYQRYLASGKEVTIDIAWKFNEAAGNEYQGAITKLNVKFYISAPSPVTPTIAPITPTVTPTLEVAGITEPFLEVLAFTGLNPIIPIAGILIMVLGAIMLTLSVVIKKKSGYKGIKR